jgi:predicted DnaQ family exonuclease/DinG family helicase
LQRFVALDLELTPLPGNRHRVIEIAAVRFSGSEATENFCTLIDPQCEITRRVEALTGIRRSDVQDAPRLEAIIPQLLAFLGDDPIVGQSVNLDIERLADSGVHLRNPAYDTFELASLLLPGLPSYDLQSIARSLDVPVEAEHRALGDALVTARVFLALVEQVSALDLDVLTSISLLAERVPNWPYRHLFQEAQRKQLRQAFLAGGAAVRALTGAAGPAPGRLPGVDHQDEQPLPESAPFGQRAATRPVAGASDSLADCTALLSSGGAVSAALPGFEERPEQLRMMVDVAAALEAGEHLLVEAGTGTGKSLAYLIPALFAALKTGEPVVVSTNTINLQDQLYQKDIPLLQKCSPFPFKAALLKGRGNYLCLRRWLVHSRSHELHPAEALLLMKVVVWLARTRTGDRAELSISSVEAPYWAKVSAQAESCAVAKCPNFRRGTCFVVKARREAQRAQVVVVNHALLLSDLATQAGVLPDYSRLIIDEAHHLEEEATEQLGFTIDRADLIGFLASVSQRPSGGRDQGFLAASLAALRLPEIDGATLVRIRAAALAASQACETADAEARSFFESLGCFVQDQPTDRYQLAARLRITPAVRVQPGWSEIEVSWSALSRELQKVRQALHQLHREIALLEDHQMLEREGMLAEMGGLLAYLDAVRGNGAEAVCSPSDNGVYWVQSGATPAELSIRCAPLHVGEALNRVLFANKESVVLTSATLTTEGSFEYIRERLGLEDAAELQVGSPFDYKKSTMLYVARDIPEPTRPTYQRAVESAIADLALALEGRTLVLFTSHSQLRSTCAAIRGTLEEQGLLVLAHGLDGSRRKLLQAFKGTPRAVLLGTSSFWEGIDVVGPALSCLVIVKLPFSVPSDPVFAARSESFDEPFKQYSVPQTILRFKQGFGRLIRSRTDRGIVAVLDSRVGSKFYGPAFIQSLPACTVRHGLASQLGEAARSWLGDLPGAAAPAAPMSTAMNAPRAGSTLISS